MDACKVCGTLFKRHYRRAGERQVYCSKACKYADAYIEKVCPTCNRSFRTNKLSARKDYCSLECIQRRDCLMCGNPVVGRNRMNNGLRRFCSRKCAGIYNRTLNGSSGYQYRVLGFACTIARVGQLACEECGTDELEVLHVHHVNGRKPGRPKPRDLKTICANCHDRRHRTGSVSRTADAKRALALAPMIARHL